MIFVANASHHTFCVVNFSLVYVQCYHVEEHYNVVQYVVAMVVEDQVVVKYGVEVSV